MALTTLQKTAAIEAYKVLEKLEYRVAKEVLNTFRRVIELDEPEASYEGLIKGWCLAAYAFQVAQQEKQSFYALVSLGLGLVWQRMHSGTLVDPDEFKLALDQIERQFKNNEHKSKG